jgi:hypothetical protein
MPGSNARALEKARTLSADALILDLEDAVAPDAKELARQQVCAAVEARGFGKREIIIRVNALSTPWGEADLAAATAAKPDAILVPKISSPKDLHNVEEHLLRHHAARGLDVGAQDGGVVGGQVEVVALHAFISPGALIEVAAASGGAHAGHDLHQHRHVGLDAARRSEVELDDRYSECHARRQSVRAGAVVGHLLRRDRD